MRTLEIVINGEPIEKGANNARLLTLTLVGKAGESKFWLGLSGLLQEDDGRIQSVEWLGQSINPNDIIEVTPHDSRNPARSNKEPDRSIETVLPSFSGGMRFDIESIELGRRLQTSIGPHKILQLVATWHAIKDSCSVSVEALTTFETGHGDGQTLATLELEPGNSMRIIVGA